MRFLVESVAINRQTRARIPFDFPGQDPDKPRAEVIDTEMNWWFRNSETPLEVEDAYERYWNQINPHSEAICKVVGVTRIPDAEEEETS